MERIEWHSRAPYKNLMRDLPKFLLKCFIMITGVVCLCLLVTKAPLVFLDQEAPYYLWNKEITDSKQDKEYDIIILGDSVANAAYVPEVLSDYVINLALGGTTPVENYYTMRDWLKQNSAPKVCYISFIDFHLQTDDCFWTRTMYFHRYDLLQNLEMLKAAQKFQEPSILTKQYLRDFLAFELYFPSTYITPILGTDLKQRYHRNITELQNDGLHNGRYIGRGIREYSSSEKITYDKFYVSKIFDHYYRKLIELCIDHDIKVHLIKLPLPDNTNHTERYIKEYDGYYEQIKADYPEITVDRSLSYPQEYFADPVHLNSHGALEFSTMLKRMHPEEFGDADPSLRQVEAINDAIKEEKTIEWIIKWIQDKEYTLFFLDGSGRFPSVYEKICEDNGIKRDLNRLKTGSNQNVFYISGLANQTDPEPVISSGGGGQ